MKKVIAAIRKHKKFLVAAHVNPEGDSLCSQLAMRALLLPLGKEVRIVNNDPVPEHYKFLPHADEIHNTPDSFVFDAAVILDCPTLRRTGIVASMIPERCDIINVDHHISNEKFGKFNWVDPHASSAGEMVYHLFKEMDVEITKDVALCLYIAILTDTGSFNYDNTSSITHEIAGELMGYGLDPAVVSESVYERRTLADIKFLSIVLSTLNVNTAGDVASLEITRDMISSTGVDLTKSEGIINYARSIEHVKIAILFKEDLKDSTRINISFRSKGDVDVNKLAAIFGGGGHTKASGCFLRGTLSDVKRRVLERAEEVLRGRRASHR